MSHTTETKQKDLLNTQLNIPGTEDNKNSALAVNEHIEGTPFMLIMRNDKWFLAIANNRITEPTTTKEETLEKLEKEKWLLIAHIATIFAEKIIEQRKMEENLKPV